MLLESKYNKFLFEFLFFFIRVAVKRVSFGIKNGECFGLLGNNLILKIFISF
jgi:ABC-type multidrug transport system ATPase subunit